MGGNYQILHIQIVKKLPVDGYLLAASGGPPLHLQIGSLPEKWGLNSPGFPGPWVKSVLDIYVKGPAHSWWEPDKIIRSWF